MPRHFNIGLRWNMRTSFLHQSGVKAFPARDCSNKPLTFTYFLSAYGPHTLEHMPSFLKDLWSTNSLLEKLGENPFLPSEKEQMCLSNLFLFFKISLSYYLNLLLCSLEVDDELKVARTLKVILHFSIYWYLAYSFLNLKSSAKATRYQFPEISPLKQPQQNADEHLYHQDHSKHITFLVQLCLPLIFLPRLYNHYWESGVSTSTT